MASLHAYTNFCLTSCTYRIEIVPKLTTSQHTCTVQRQLCIVLKFLISLIFLGNNFSISTSIPGRLISESKIGESSPFSPCFVSVSFSAAFCDTEM